MSLASTGVYMLSGSGCGVRAVSVGTQRLRRGAHAQLCELAVMPGEQMQAWVDGWCVQGGS